MCVCVLQMRKQRPSAERIEEVIKRFSGRNRAEQGVKQDEMRAVMSKLGHGLSVHLHRLLCYVQCGPPPGDLCPAQN